MPLGSKEVDKPKPKPTPNPPIPHGI